MKKKSSKSNRSAIPQGGNDCVYTPYPLAMDIVRHFQIKGKRLDPAKGPGAFYNAMEAFDPDGFVEACEITEGTDFLTIPISCHYDWVCTNPPWSKFRAFLKRSMEVSDNIVFLAYANAWFVRSRVNDMAAAGFHFREFLYVDNPPKPWPQMGLQLAAVHISRTPGPCHFSRLAAA